MSSNESESTYNSIYLKKTTYNSYSNGTIIKKFKVNNLKNKEKVKHVVVTTDSSGNKVCKIRYST